MQPWGILVKHIWTDTASQAARPTRVAERLDVALPGRLTWKDTRGATRFVSVVTRNLSEQGAFVVCSTPVSIPLYRLVQFQLERSSHDSTRLPPSLRQGRVLSAVYRVQPATREGDPQCLALRLLVDPRRAAIAPREERSAATA